VFVAVFFFFVYFFCLLIYILLCYSPGNPWSSNSLRLIGSRPHDRGNVDRLNKGLDESLWGVWFPGCPRLRIRLRFRSHSRALPFVSHEASGSPPCDRYSDQVFALNVVALSWRPMARIIAGVVT